MAFICDWCRDKLLDDRGHLKGFVRSKGACELCANERVPLLLNKVRLMLDLGLKND